MSKHKKSWTLVCDSNIVISYCIQLVAIKVKKESAKMINYRDLEGFYTNIALCELAEVSWDDANVKYSWEYLPIHHHTHSVIFL